MERLTGLLAAVSAELAEERANGATLKRLVDRAKDRIRELEQADRREADGFVVVDEAAGPDGFDADGVDLVFGDRARFATEQVEVDAAPARPKSRRRSKAERLAARAEKKLKAAKQTENVYVFDDHDEGRAAFDEFFAKPDPHLDKVRGFLLD